LTFQRFRLDLPVLHGDRHLAALNGLGLAQFYDIRSQNLSRNHVVGEDCNQFLLVLGLEE